MLVTYLIRDDQNTPQQFAVVLSFGGTAGLQSIKLGRIGPGYAVLAPFGDRIAVVGEDGRPRYRDVTSAPEEDTNSDTEAFEYSDFEVTDCGSFPESGVFGVRRRYRSDGDKAPDSIAFYVWDHEKLKRQNEIKSVLPGQSAAVSQNGGVYVLTRESLRLLSGHQNVVFEAPQFKLRSTEKSTVPSIFRIKNKKNFDVIVNQRGEQLLTSKPDRIFPPMASAVNAAINLDENGKVGIATDREVQIGEWGADRFAPLGTLPGGYLRLAYLGSTYIEPGFGNPMGRPKLYVAPPEKPEPVKPSNPVSLSPSTETRGNVNQTVIERRYTYVVEDPRSRQFWDWIDMIRNYAIKALWATSFLGALGYGVYRMNKKSNAPRTS